MGPIPHLIAFSEFSFYKLKLCGDFNLFIVNYFKLICYIEKIVEYGTIYRLLFAVKHSIIAANVTYRKRHVWITTTYLKSVALIDICSHIHLQEIPLANLLIIMHICIYIHTRNNELCNARSFYLLKHW